MEDFSWSLSSGALPNGLTLSTAGVISGTPATANTYNFSVRAINSAGNVTKDLSITISSSGGGGANQTITIKNETGYTFTAGYLKNPKAVYWGENRIISPLANNQSRTITLTQPISENNVYDFSFASGTHSNDGEAFRRYSVTITDGMTVVINDTHYSSKFDGQTILYLNRTGTALNSLSIWSPDLPAGGAKWSGTVNNNNYTGSYTTAPTLIIAVRPSVTTVFNFQMESLDPAIKYTKNNVTVTQNLQIMFTASDSDYTVGTYKPVIIVKNNTGSELAYVYIRRAGASTWGTDLLTINLQNGQSYAFVLNDFLSVHDKYDIRVQQMFTNFVKWNVQLTDGMVLEFDSTDMP